MGKYEKLNIVIRGGKPWGFVITGGSDYKKNLTIKASQDSGLQVDDVIISINGEETHQKNHNQCKDLIIMAKTSELDQVENFYLNAPETAKPAEQPKPVVAPAVVAPVAAAPAVHAPAVAPAVTPAAQAHDSAVRAEAAAVAASGGVQYLGDDDEDKNSPYVSPFMKRLQTALDNNTEVPSAVNPDGSPIPKPENVRKPVTNIKQEVILDKPIQKAPAAAAPKATTSNDSHNHAQQQAAVAAAHQEQQKAAAASNFIGSAMDAAARSKHTEAEVKPGEVPTCRYCNEKITKGITVSAVGATWHKEHFKCKVCDAVLYNKSFFKYEDGVCCDNCQPKQTNIHMIDTVNTQQCNFCKQHITDKTYIKTHDYYYHENCFKCDKCKRIIGLSKYSIDSGKPICEQCYEEEFLINCHKCNSKITPGQAYVEVNGKNYHSTCWLCTSCGTKLTSYRMKNEQPFCPLH